MKNALSILMLLAAVALGPWCGCSKSKPTDTTHHAVTLNVVSVTSSSASLAWTMATESDFSAYRLYRSTKAGLGRSGTPVGTFSNVRQISAHDTALCPGRTYYYKVFVDYGQSTMTASNEASTTTNAATGLIIGLDPAIAVMANGGSSAVEVWVANVEDLFGATFSIMYDHSKIAIDSTKGHDFLGADVIYFDHVAQDTIDVAITRTSPQSGISGGGSLAAIYFHALTSGADSIYFGPVSLEKNDGALINNFNALSKRNVKIIVQ
ncbi:MAG: cohesin domain-containing protein [Candidatus Edwardsbacteria bacterium]|nr:cohesin domain-containing protein [Candidatus Edwardsbacteria bacterium]